MSPQNPGTFIRDEILEELGLSVSEAADALGVRRATLSDLMNGNAALWPEMALRIEKAFSASIWKCCCGCRHGTTLTQCDAGPERSM
jgi:addiction module HigA family antidote